MDAQEYKRKRKRKGSLVMNKDVYGILGDLTAEILLEIIAECMDDYLYVIDLQNNKMEISQSALDRFMISETHVRNVKQEIMSVVYEEDRTMFAKHMQAVMDGKEKVHDIHYRWLDKNGLPVWVNCRGVVIDDEDGKPGYLVGCLNETGNQRRADNVTGLLGGMEFCAYLRSQKKPVTTGFLMHIGIDDFATVNETHGSNYGDYVLKSVADCMKECLSGNVLNEAAKMCREIQQYIPEFSVNVNISCYQIEHGKIADKILTAVRDNGLMPDRICIEMTESGFMDMTPVFCKFRKVLEENGIQFVIDDFGTGYSNLHCISDMNPGYVKMDKDFTAKAMSCERDYELFKKIIEMVHSIGIRICVEGIEKEDWHLKMKELQADYLQGYFFGKPCEKKKFMEEFVCNPHNNGVW